MATGDIVVNVHGKTIDAQPLYNLLVQGEMNLTTVVFRLDKVVNGVDLSTDDYSYAMWGINQHNQTAMDVLEKSNITGNKFDLTWTVGQTFTTIEGEIGLHIYITKPNDKGEVVGIWETTRANVTIRDGVVVSDHISITEDLLFDLATFLNAAKAAAASSGNSAEMAAKSEANAAESATQAAASAASIVGDAEAAAESAEAARQYEESAKASADNAKESETNTASDAQLAKTAQEAAKVSEENAKIAESNARLSASGSKTNELSSWEAANQAITSRTAAQESQQNAALSAAQAKQSEENTAEYEYSAKESASNAKDSENNTKTTESNIISLVNSSQLILQSLQDIISEDPDRITRAAKTILTSLKIVKDITTGETDTVQNMFDKIFGANCLTAAEYAALGLTAAEYAGYGLTASQYATNSRTLLSRRA